MNKRWTPRISFAQAQAIVEVMSKTFTKARKINLQFQAAFAVRNLDGQAVSGTIVQRLGYDIVLYAHVPQAVRLQDSGKTWTEPLVLFRGKIDNPEDPTSDWQFQQMLTLEDFRKWKSDSAKIYVVEEDVVPV